MEGQLHSLCIKYVQKLEVSSVMAQSLALSLAWKQSKLEKDILEMEREISALKKLTTSIGKKYFNQRKNLVKDRLDPKNIEILLRNCQYIDGLLLKIEILSKRIATFSYFFQHQLMLKNCQNNLQSTS